eukprot:4932314-Alexandrium_andersonii.AAC.1
MAAVLRLHRGGGGSAVPGLLAGVALAWGHGGAVVLRPCAWFGVCGWRRLRRMALCACFPEGRS